MTFYMFAIQRGIISLITTTFLGQTSSFFCISVHYVLLFYCFIVLKLKLLNFSSHFKNIIHIRELESYSRI
jgi:hypothetical protein